MEKLRSKYRTQHPGENKLQNELIQNEMKYTKEECDAQIFTLHHYKPQT